MPLRIFDAISSMFKFCTESPKPSINLYNSTLKNEDMRKYYTFIYSKEFHTTFLIAKFNVDNTSSATGVLHSVKLEFKDWKTKLKVEPIRIDKLAKDKVLIEYLSTSEFKNSIFFNNELELKGFEKKTIYFIFDVEDRANNSFDNNYTLIFRTSDTSKNKTLKLTVPSRCYTNHYSREEISNHRKTKNKK